MTPETVLTRSESASYEIVADEAILIDVNSGTYFSLNSVGTEFWQHIDGQQSIADIAATLAAKYAVDSQMVADDLIELATTMLNEGLVS
jgi:hypothetical protein